MAAVTVPDAVFDDDAVTVPVVVAVLTEVVLPVAE
jgi:hypothetical protein